MKFHLFRRWPEALAGSLVILCLWQRANAQSDAALEQALNQMDQTAATFRTAEASLAVDLYTSVVKETDTQHGKVYFRREGSDTQMALQMIDPPKYVLLSDGKLQLFEPTADRVTVYDVRKHEGEFETFLRLGFGGGGHVLRKSFELKYLGTEKIAGIETAKLDLVPHEPKVLRMFPDIILWIDPARGISVQQQLFLEQPGDYRLTRYSEIQINRKIPDAVFKLKTNGKTTFQNMSPPD